jgi:hypothetical protein
MYSQQDLETVATIKKMATEIAGLPLERLLHPELGPLGFTDSKDFFEDIQRYCGKLAQAALQFVPSNELGNIRQFIHALANEINNVVQFDGREGQQQRNRALSGVLGARNNVLHTTAPYIAVAQALAPSAMADPTIAEQIATLHRDFDNFYTVRNKALSEINDAKEAAKRAAQDVGITSESTHFQRAADTFRRTSWGWFTGIVVAAFGVLCAILFITTPPASEDPSGIIVSNMAAPATKTNPPASRDALEVVEHSIVRIALLSLAFTLLLFCLRNFSAARHNYIVNQHRAIALTTFQTFVTSTSDQAVKNAILLQAAQSIFSASRSGYLKDESDPPQITYINDVVKNVGSGSGGS